MNKQLNYIAIFMLTLISFHTYAQKENLIGFWKVENVNVGKKNMTPVAKWTKINADGTFQSGNGWLQNSEGTWTYDINNNIFTTSDPLDIADEYGGFTLTFDNGKMYWERMEEGMQVKVTLGRILKRPMAPADYLKGMWDLVEITDDEKSILTDFDPTNTHKLHIRWDRIYRNYTAEGKKLSGYWHINGHRPNLTFLPHQEGANAESWTVEVNEKELIMTGISDDNQSIRRKYKRINIW